MIQRSDIVAAARTYLGVKWTHRGRSRSGLDCIGLLLVVGRDLGIEVHDTPLQYHRTPDPNLFKEMVRSQTDAGSINDIKSGSILMLNQAAFPCHCGIAVVEGSSQTFIHAALSNRTVREEPLSEFYRMVFDVREYKGVL